MRWRRENVAYADAMDRESPPTTPWTESVVGDALQIPSDGFWDWTAQPRLVYGSNLFADNFSAEATTSRVAPQTFSQAQLEAMLDEDDARLDQQLLTALFGASLANLHDDAAAED
jgi:hypothetical protein